MGLSAVSIRRDRECIYFWTKNKSKEESPNEERVWYFTIAEVGNTVIEEGPFESFAECCTTYYARHEKESQPSD